MPEALLPEPVVAWDGHIRINPVAEPVSVMIDGQLVARSSKALRLEEGGRPGVYYLPLADITVPVVASDLSTHCRWKGDANYYDLTIAGKTYANAIWAYAAAKEEVAILRPYVSFDLRFADVKLGK